MEIVIVVVLCGVLALAYMLFGRGSWETPKSTQADAKTLQAYEARAHIFVNVSERTFFKALIRHKLDGYHVFAKVRLEDILQVRRAVFDQRKRWEYRGRIKSRHVDFVICDNEGQYICAIELDGSSHDNQEAKMVDSFKDAIFKSAGLPLYRMQTGHDFDRFSRELWAKIAI